MDSPWPLYVDVVGGGLVVADLDDNGLLDVFLPGPEASRLYLQTAPRVFVDVAPAWLRGIDLTEASAATAVDGDGDGDLDLLVLRFMRPTAYLRNDGGVFVDITGTTGLRDRSWPATGGAWGDFDRDGDLDLMIGYYYDRRIPGGVTGGDDLNQLFRNNGDGTFTDISEQLPRMARTGTTFTVGWHDLDEDGWLDLLVINDFGQVFPTELFWNRQGVLVQDDRSTGLRFRMNGMGMGVGDLNGDCVEDFVFSSQAEVVVQESVGGAWFRTGAARGFTADVANRQQWFGWGTEIADLDLDGDDDVVIGYGHWFGFDSYYEQSDSLFRQQDDGTFVDVAVEEGMDAPSITRGLAVADVDRDGCPDVVRRQLGTSVLIDFGGCTGGSWLEVELRAPPPNTRAIGATIRAIGPERHWMRSIGAGNTSLFTGGPPEALFGFGDLDEVDLEVSWPDGLVQRIDGVRTRRRLLIHRP